MKYLFFILFLNLPLIADSKFDEMIGKIDKYVFDENFLLAENFLLDFNGQNANLLTIDSLNVEYLDKLAQIEYYLGKYKQADSTIHISMDLSKKVYRYPSFRYIELFSIANAITLTLGNTTKFDEDLHTFFILVDSLNKVNEQNEPANNLWYCLAITDHLYTFELFSKANKFNEMDYLYNSIFQEFKQRGYENSWSYGFLLLSFSNFNFNLGLLDEQEKLSKEALRITSLEKYKNQDFSYTPYCNLTANAFEKRDYNKALEYNKKAYEIIQKGFNYDEFGHTLLKFGSINQKLGQFSNAEKDFISADSCFNLADSMRIVQNYPKDYKSMSYPNFIRASNFMSWGALLMDEKKYDDAEIKLNQALVLLKKYDDFEFVSRTKNCLLKLAQLKRLSGNKLSCDSVFHQVISTNNYLIKNVLLNLSEYQKDKFLLKIKPDYDIYNNYLFENIYDNDTAAVKMLNARINSKGMLFYSSKKFKDILRANPSPEINELVSSYNIVNSQMSNLLIKNRATASIHDSQFDSLLSLSNNLDKKINRILKLKNNEIFTQVKDWRVIRDRLADDEAAIEIIRIPKYGFYPNKYNPKVLQYQTSDSADYLGFIIRKNSKQPEFIVFENPNSLENVEYKNYLKSINTKTLDIQNKSTKELNNSSRKQLKHAYKTYFESFDKKLNGIKKVYISNDGIFNKVNLDILIDNSGKYLLEKYDIIIVSSIKDLAKENNKNLNPNKNAVLIGGIDYNNSSKDVDKSITKLSKNIENERAGNLFTSVFRDLPYSKVEVENIDITLRLKGWKTNILENTNANEDNIKTIISPKILHIASHAYFLTNDSCNKVFEKGSNLDNPFINNGLILAGANNSIRQYITKSNVEQKNDGILTAYEAKNLNLDSTDLLVLSACETGNGTINNGEGVYGLQRAFQIAGANKIILSLWKVDDEATQTLFNLFYPKYLATDDVKQSLKKAQLEMLKIPKFSNPKYWGAFIVFGN